MTDTTFEVNISRYFDAPPELVYRAFTDPEQLAQWFGPLMFTVPLDTVDVDVRPGGHWEMTMVGKDNPEWRAPIDATFTEVVENQLLVGYETAESDSRASRTAPGCRCRSSSSPKVTAPASSCARARSPRRCAR